MKKEAIMQRFIDGRILVFCNNIKEIEDFLNVCDQYHLRTRSGDNVARLLKECGQCATFVNRYPNATDGISYWSRSVSKDEYPKKIEDFVLWEHETSITSLFDDIDNILKL